MGLGLFRAKGGLGLGLFRAKGGLGLGLFMAKGGLGLGLFRAGPQALPCILLGGPIGELFSGIPQGIVFRTQTLFS